AGSRIRTWHLMPTERMDPPPGASPPMRMTASWSGSNDPTVYKSVARRCAPMASSPRILKRQTGTVPTLKICKKVPVAGHHRSACSGVKALRNTSLARAASRQALLAFRSLDPFRARRESDPRRRDEKRPFPLRTKNCQHNPNNRLTGKAPYKFESAFLQRRVERRKKVASTPIGGRSLDFCSDPTGRIDPHAAYAASQSRFRW